VKIGNPRKPPLFWQFRFAKSHFRGGLEPRADENGRISGEKAHSPDGASIAGEATLCEDWVYVREATIAFT
jgi:hypothetical protein